MKVRSPGSSANLGPGYDVLGLAVSRFAWAMNEADRISGEPCDETHIARVAYEAAGGTEPIWFSHQIEPGRGLGFSAAARAAGALLAKLEQELEYDNARDSAYQIVFDLEGHGDNAAPAIYGGLQIIAGETRHQAAIEAPGEIVFWVPQDSTPTDKSRAGLPEQISREDAVYNIGRIAILIAAMYENNSDLLAVGAGDRLHQPHRLPANPQAEKLQKVAIEAGAYSGWLSGSGPSLAFWVPAGGSAQIIEALKSESSDTEKVFSLELDLQGAVIDQSVTPSGPGESS